jgi:hypothetical protein
MLTRYVVNLLRFCGFEHLIHVVELIRFGIMTQIAGVNNKIRRSLQSIDFVHGCTESADNVRIRGLVKADVAVADLNEMKLSSDVFGVLAESLGTQNATADSPKDASAGPSHAFEKSSPVDAIVIVVVSH